MSDTRTIIQNLLNSTAELRESALKPIAELDAQINDVMKQITSPTPEQQEALTQVCARVAALREHITESFTLPLDPKDY